jgi:hypothetical protein
MWRRGAAIGRSRFSANRSRLFDDQPGVLLNVHPVVSAKANRFAQSAPQVSTTVNVQLAKIERDTCVWEGTR